MARTAAETPGRGGTRAPAHALAAGAARREGGATITTAARGGPRRRWAWALALACGAAALAAGGVVGLSRGAAPPPKAQRITALEVTSLNVNALAPRLVQAQRYATLADATIATWGRAAWCGTGNPARLLAAGASPGAASGPPETAAVVGRSGLGGAAALVPKGQSVQVGFCQVVMSPRGLYQDGLGLDGHINGPPGSAITSYTGVMAVEISYTDRAGPEHALVVENVVAGGTAGPAKVEAVGPVLAFYQTAGKVTRPTWVRTVTWERPKVPGAFVAPGAAKDSAVVAFPPPGTTFAPGVGERPQTGGGGGGGGGPSPGQPGPGKP